MQFLMLTIARRQALVLLALSAATGAAVATIGLLLSSVVALATAAGFSILVLGIILVGFSNRLAWRIGQVEARLALHDFLPEQSAWWHISVYSARPDFLLAIVREMDACTPEQVVELGAGISTLIMSQMLKRQGASRPLISIENDAAHARMVQMQLERLGLSDYARLVIAELVPYQGPSNVDVWYDVGVVLGAVDSVDMLVVDGPPIRLAKHARLPAMEVFAPHLGPGAIVLLDDAKRPDERQILKEWKRAYPQVSVEMEPSERGIAKITWPDASN